MLSEHRQVDDEHSKIDVFYKVIAASSLINREWLKQGRCSKASWVAPIGEQDTSLSRSPFIFRLCGQLDVRQLRGCLVRDYPVRDGSGLVLQGMKGVILGTLI